MNNLIYFTIFPSTLILHLNNYLLPIHGYFTFISQLDIGTLFWDSIQIS